LSRSTLNRPFARKEKFLLVRIIIIYLNYIHHETAVKQKKTAGKKAKEAAVMMTAFIPTAAQRSKNNAWLCTREKEEPAGMILLKNNKISKNSFI
jgi:hypothetical protein